jgi:hypothetical protein
MDAMNIFRAQPPADAFDSPTSDRSGVQSFHRLRWDLDRSSPSSEQSGGQEYAVRFPSPRSLKEQHWRRKARQREEISRRESQSTTSPSCGSIRTQEDSHPLPPARDASPSSSTPQPPTAAPPAKHRPFKYNELFDYSYFTRVCGYESPVGAREPRPAPPPAGFGSTFPTPSRVRPLRYNELFDYSYFTAVCGHESLRTGSAATITPSPCHESRRSTSEPPQPSSGGTVEP